MTSSEVWMLQGLWSTSATVDSDGRLCEYPKGITIADRDRADNDALRGLKSTFDQLVADGSHRSLVFELAAFDTGMLQASNGRSLLVAPGIVEQVRPVVGPDFVHPTTVNGDPTWSLVIPPTVSDPVLGSNGYVAPVFVGDDVQDYEPSFDWRPALSSAEQMGAGIFRPVSMAFPVCGSAVKAELEPLVDLDFAPIYTAETHLNRAMGGDLI